MNIETRLRESLQERGEKIFPPAGLKMKVISNISAKSKIKKRILTGVLTASLLIPTSVFASQFLLPDELYGSFDNLKTHIVSITMEGYLRLDAKLAKAKGELGDDEYNEFISLVKNLTSAKLEYGDKHGNINFESLPEVKEEEMKKILFEIQPYFDRLNNLPSSKDLLTAEEYNRYIDSLMTQQEIMEKSGVNPDHYVKIEEISPSLQAEFQEVRDFINYVNEKQTQ
ncbi:DUF3600 domain-containing protein [Cytobacillus firmus]|uniref:DUF3600 domain-containing protein n=1 Tax=Cytobacillus firmus TaxID=1399 RepID=UPI0022283080|nr:DUF3600 domain-containing protein [Cytobacillus firmus]